MAFNFRNHDETKNTAVYRLRKIKLPFEGWRWALQQEGVAREDQRFSFFSTYRTKKEALEDVKKYELNLINP